MKPVSKATLQELIWTKRLKDVASDLGVTPSCIIERCNQLGIPRPHQKLWSQARKAALPFPKGIIQEEWISSSSKRGIEKHATKERHPSNAYKKPGPAPSWVVRRLSDAQAIIRERGVDDPITSLLVSRSTETALITNGIERLSDFLSLDADKMMALRNVGIIRIRDILNGLDRHLELTSVDNQAAYDDEEICAIIQAPVTQ